MTFCCQAKNSFLRKLNANLFSTCVKKQFLIQSEEGKGLGSCSSISFPQQPRLLPSPGVVQRVSLPHTSHRYLFPSCIMFFLFPRLAASIALTINSIQHYFLTSMGWPQWVTVPLPPLVMIISAPHFLQTYLLPTRFAINFLPPLTHLPSIRFP
jgi:hypothetical protein